MLRSVDGQKYMTQSPVVFTPETSIFDAIHQILIHRISGATVVDKNNQVVGIISELDCLKAILDVKYYGETSGTVGQYMTKSVESVSSEASIIDVANQMLKGNRRRLPVVKNNRFIGQYSCRSILKAMKDFDGPIDPKEDKVYL